MLPFGPQNRLGRLTSAGHGCFGKIGERQSSICVLKTARDRIRMQFIDDFHLQLPQADARNFRIFYVCLEKDCCSSKKTHAKRIE